MAIIGRNPLIALTSDLEEAKIAPSKEKDKELQESIIILFCNMIFFVGNSGYPNRKRLLIKLKQNELHDSIRKRAPFRISFGIRRLNQVTLHLVE